MTLSGIPATTSSLPSDSTGVTGAIDLPLPCPKMGRIDKNRIAPWIFVATTVLTIIAATTDLKTRPFVTVTLPHPCSIVPYLCSPRACSFSPATSFCTGADDNVYSGAKIFVANHHVLAHSESVILAQPFHSDGDGPVRDDDNIQATTSNRTCSDVHDRLDHLDDGDFGFLDDILPTSEYNNDHLFGTNSSPPVSISVSHTATARSTSPDARERPMVDG